MRQLKSVKQIDNKMTKLKKNMSQCCNNTARTMN